MAQFYKLNKGFIVQKNGEEFSIFDGEKSVLYTFNTTASFIFNKLKQGFEVSQITHLLKKKYKHVEENILIKDMDEFMKLLEEKKIIEKKLFSVKPKK